MQFSAFSSVLDKLGHIIRSHMPTLPTFDTSLKSSDTAQGQDSEPQLVNVPRQITWLLLNFHLSVVMLFLKCSLHCTLQIEKSALRQCWVGLFVKLDSPGCFSYFNVSQTIHLKGKMIREK